MNHHPESDRNHIKRPDAGSARDRTRSPRGRVGVTILAGALLITGGSLAVAATSTGHGGTSTQSEPQSCPQSWPHSAPHSDPHSDPHSNPGCEPESHPCVHPPVVPGPGHGRVDGARHKECSWGPRH